jgi:hypothetical protein
MAREPDEWGGDARPLTWARDAPAARSTRQQPPGARVRGPHRSVQESESGMVPLLLRFLAPAP